MMMYDGLSFFMMMYHLSCIFMVDFFHAYSWFIIFVIDIHGLSLFIMVYDGL